MTHIAFAILGYLLGAGIVSAAFVLLPKWARWRYTRRVLRTFGRAHLLNNLLQPKVPPTARRD